MELPEIIKTLDTKKTELDLLRPLSPVQQNKLEQKLRLDWNYHSNSIEGNTLTAHETKAFIMHGITAKGKPFRDYIEMRGHNETLKKLLGLVDKDVMITERLVKELHEMILVEPYTYDKTEIAPGKYKTKPNYLYTGTGERIDFLAPEEVVQELNTLINWLNNQIEKPKRKKKKYNLHPVVISAAFQVRFIQIHPFGDGNGRLSRILGNLILMQCGYTPAIIRLEERDKYYRMLNLSSLDDPMPLAEMIASESLKTTELAIAAAQGKSIDEPDDFDKELALLKNQFVNDDDNQVKLGFEEIDLKEFIEVNFLPVLENIIVKGTKLNELFKSNQVSLHLSNKWVTSSFSKAIEDFNTLNFKEDIKNTHEFKLEVALIDFTKNGVNSYNLYWKLRVEFGKIRYTTKIDYEGETLQWVKLYHHNLSTAEQNEISDAFGNHMLSEIKRHVQKK